MALTQQQIEQRVQMARQKGWSDARIQNALRNTVSRMPQQQVQPKKSPSLIAQLAPLLGGVAGGLAGGFAGPAGIAAGGAAGSALGERYRQKASGEAFDPKKIGTEALFGSLGGIGKGFQLARGAKVAKTAAQAGRALDTGVDAARVAGTTKKAGGLGKFARNLESGADALEQGTRQIKQKASVYGAAREKAINETLNRYGIKGNAQSQYEQLAPTIQRIEGEISNVVRSNPNIGVSRKNIQQSFMSKLQSSLRSGDMTAKAAQKEVDGYIADLLKASGSRGNGQLTLQELRNLKKLVNQDYGPVNDLLIRGGTLTPRQKVIHVAWESLDDAVKDASPTMKSLLRDESNLYNAASSLSAARSNPPTFRVAGTSVPAPLAQKARELTSTAFRSGANALDKADRAAPLVQDAAIIGGTQQAGRALFGQPQAPQEETQQDFSSQFSAPQQDFSFQQEQPTQQSGIDRSVFLQAMLQDLQQTGGKNIAKIEEIAKFAGADGAGAKPAKKTEAQVAREDTVAIAEDALNQLQGGGIQTGMVAGPLQQIASKFGVADQTTLDFNTTVSMLKAAIAKARAGTSFTPGEAKLLNSYTPNVGDSKQQLETKLRKLVEFFTSRGSQEIEDPYQSMVGGLNGMLSQ